MKKILTILIIMLVMPLSISANTLAPVINNYDAVVTNPNSASIYNRERSFEKFDEKIPYGEKININQETVHNGEMYGEFTYQINQRSRKAAIKLKDINPVEEEVQPISNVGENSVIVIIEGLKLHSGPANGYKTVTGPIEKGTVLEYNYGDGDKDGGIAWIYTTYNGQKGWLEIYNYSGGRDNYLALSKEQDILTIDSFKLYSEPDVGHGAKFKQDIPEYTELTVNYEYTYYGEGYYENNKRISHEWLNVTYNGISGWIDLGEVIYEGSKYTKIARVYAYKCGTKFMAIEDVKLYSSPSKDAGINGEVFKSGEQATALYCYYNRITEDTFYYFTYNNENYWVGNYSFLAEDNYNYWTNKVCEFEEDKNIYSYPSLNSELISGVFLPQNTIIERQYKYYSLEDSGAWNYINYNGVNGWVYEEFQECRSYNFENLLIIATSAVRKAEETRGLSDYKEAEKALEELPLSSEKTLLQERLEAIDILDEDENGHANEEKSVTNLLNRVSSRTIIYASLIVAVVLGSVAIVLLKVVNKDEEF